ncbi:MAG: hypothetical protein IKX07_00995 [Bacteroidales bacterium]|nr:hypothetical protein [Bacteroidales bacterium]
MKLKSSVISAAIFLAASSGLAAQSLLDLPGLLGMQTGAQDNPVKVEYNVDFHYFFDLRNFHASDDIFMMTETYNVARFSPSAILRFDQNRSITHRLALGVDLTKNLGVNPTSEATYSESEHQQSLRNFDLIKDIFFYYNYRNRLGKGVLDFYAGIYPRTVLGGDYTRAIFADDLVYYDPNLEGMTVKYEAPRFRAEATFDILGKRGIDRVGGEMVSTAGAFKLIDWASLGWAASYAHSNGNYLAYCDTDVAYFNPYAKVDFGSKLGMQELSLKAGAIASYQLDYSIASEDDETGISSGERAHFPMGAEAVLNVRNWDLGIEDTFYYGDNQMIYCSNSYADISSATVYSGTIYSGQTFYYTRRGYPSWYNRLELYWQPLNGGFVSTRISAVSHFIMPSGEGEDRIGPFIGMQAKASVLFNLDAFRHPRENAAGGRRNRQARQSQPVPTGPAISL